MKNTAFILLLLILVTYPDICFPQGNEKLKIALVYPQLTKEVLYKTDTTFNPTDSWELFLMSKNYKYEGLDDDDLGSVGSDIKVLIIPSMTVIDDDIIGNIKRIAESGTGILITGNFALYNEDGNKTDQDYQEEITGFHVLRLNEVESISVNHFLNGSTPFSIGLKPGQKILLSKKPALYYSSGLSENCRPLGKYYPADGEFSGMVSCLSVNKRILWYGFNLDQLIGKNRDRLIANSFNWLASVPEAFVNYWPSDYSAAGLFYRDLERSFEIDSTLLYQNSASKINYFIAPRIYDDSKDFLKIFKDSLNVNLIWDDFFFSRMNRSEKESWLRDVRSAVKKYSEQNYTGVLSFGGFYDSTAADLLSRTGYSFIFTSGYSESFASDYDSSYNMFLFTRTDSPGKDYLTRLNFIRNSGGVFYVNVDSIPDNGFSLPGKNNYWITTFPDLINWLNNREQISVKTRSDERGDFEIRVKNNSSRNIRNTGIWVSLPHTAEDVFLDNRRETGGLTYDPGKMMYFLKINILEGYQELTYRISVQE